MHSQGDHGPLEHAPFFLFIEKKGEEVAAQPAQVRDNLASKNSLEGPIQNFEIAICTPPNFDKFTPPLS